MITLELESFLSGDDYYHIHRYIDNGKDNPLIHRHSYCEIFWIEYGTGIHLFNTQELDLKKNHLYIIRPFDSHAFITKSKLQQVNIAFPIESLENLCHRYNYPFMDICTAPFRWSLYGKNPVKVNNLLDNLLENENTQFNLELFLMNLFAILKETDGKELFNAGNLTNKTVSWMQDFINLLADEKNLSLSLDSLSNMVGRTREHISRQIKKYYNTSPSRIILDRRIKFAKKQLTMTENPIIDIAFSCGFSSLSQFYKIFRESTGVTPLTFRKNRP